MLSVEVSRRFGPFLVEARFESEGGVTALFGPSGTGKTSIVNMIAGLLKPDLGYIVADGDILDDTRHGVHVPAYRRRIGYVFQDARLFPHLSVAQNLDYGRRMNGLPKSATEHDDIVQLLDLQDLLSRRPGKLSGGEKQRVALGRALLSRPRLLLLDEPLGSLDKERKDEILPYLIRLRDRGAVPMIYVSHDSSEVEQLATQVIRIPQRGVSSRAGGGFLPPRVES